MKSFYTHTQGNKPMQTTEYRYKDPKKRTERTQKPK